MARPYSQDSWDRVIGSVASGRTCRVTAALFGVSVASVVKWSQRWRASGSAAAKPMGGRKQLLLNSQREWLLARIAEKPAVIGSDSVKPTPNMAMDRKGINQALTLGRSHLTNSIIPESFEFYWQPPLPIYDPAKAKELLAEAGHPNGFDAGEFFCDTSYRMSPRRS
jgi:transposase